MWSLDNLNGDFAEAANSVEIREVWDSNMEEEFSIIRSIITDYPFVCMDTEFPGIILTNIILLPTLITPISFTAFNYHILQLNVNALKLLQLGLTFFNSSGCLPLVGSPPHPCIWQFNFREFDLTIDMYDPRSIEHLYHSGMDLEKNHRLGVTTNRFSELIISSGLVHNDSVNWITLNSCFDFGYLLKTLTSNNLPAIPEDFCRHVRLYFPKLYDIKHLLQFFNPYGGLNNIAETLGVRRVGAFHQTGSDSLLAAVVFKKLKDYFFRGTLERYAGVLYGLAVGRI